MASLQTQLNNLTKLVNDQQRQINDLHKQLNLIAKEINNNLPHVNNNNANNGALVMTKQNVMDIITTQNAKMGKVIFDKVVERVEKEVEKVNNNIDWLKEQTLDGAEVVKQYHNAVASHDYGYNTKSITDGNRNRVVIGEHVRMLFDE